MTNITGYITDYDAIGTIDRTADVLEIVDVSANTSFKVTVNNLVGISGGNVVSTSDSQTLTNKILGITNTFTVLDSAFTIQDNGDNTKQVVFQASGLTTGNTRTITIPDASLTIVGAATTQTLTNKTLTSPTITGGTLDNATVTVDAVAGHTTSNTGTVYGVAITAGVISSNSAIGDGTILPKSLQTGTGSSWVTTTITPTKVGWVSTTKNIWQYLQMGKMVWMYFDVSGTSNSTSTSVTLPVAARSFSAANDFEGTYGLASDNGSTTAGPRWNIDLSGSATTCNFFTTYGGGAWTASGTKQIRGYIIYEAA